MKINEQSPNPLGPGQAGGAGQAGGPGQAGRAGQTNPAKTGQSSSTRSTDRVSGADSSQSARGRGAVSSNEPDQVQLSSFSQELRVQTEGSPERLERVDQLRADYRAGRYQPDSFAVSKSIVADALRSDPKTGL